MYHKPSLPSSTCPNLCTAGKFGRFEQADHASLRSTMHAPMYSLLLVPGERAEQDWIVCLSQCSAIAFPQPTACMWTLFEHFTALSLHLPTTNTKGVLQRCLHRQGCHCLLLLLTSAPASAFTKLTQRPSPTPHPPLNAWWHCPSCKLCSLPGGSQTCRV